VPPLIGASQVVARQVLGGDHLRLAYVQEPNLYFTIVGQVTATSPGGGDLAQAGTVATVFLSMGPVACLHHCTSGSPSVKMPDICGESYEDAAATLAIKGITLLPYDGNLNPVGWVTGSNPPTGKNFQAFGPGAQAVTVTLAAHPPASATAGPSC
jgi:hypothetical protein